MRIKNGFSLRDICGENIIVAEGIENVDFTKIISLNESAALLWRKVDGRDFTEDDLVRILLDEYEVDEAVARTDVRSMLDTWRHERLISES